MSSKLDEIKKRAEAAARELDQKYEIKSKLEKGSRAVSDAVRKGSEIASSAADVAREEVNRIDREHKISEKIGETARRAGKAAQDTLRDSGASAHAGAAVNSAKSMASDLFGQARRYYSNASGAARAGTSAARLPWSARDAVSSARDWIKANPGKAAVVTLALAAGTRAGTALLNLDVTLLGAAGSGHWLFHSAAFPYGLRKISEKYEAYLRRQEELLNRGEIDEAERARIKFERDMAKYVGAPLLGAFSVSAGAGLLYEAFTGAAVTGLPVSLVVGGSPLLASIWLFSNGLVCFHNGYKFFMMALGDQPEVARVVRDIKGLLPVGS